jgi:hypothetical protein
MSKNITRARLSLPKQIGRRSMLRGMLGGAAVALGLPLLDAMVDGNGTRLANGQALPKRFGTFYWGGGIVHNTWVPTTTGAGFELTDSLQPFVNVRDHLSLVTGTQHAGSSPGHIPARGIALSASHDMSICQGDCIGVYRGQNHPLPSIDSLVADAFDGETPYRSLEVSICQKGPYKNNSSWRAGGTTYNRHEPSPQALFDRIFAGFTPSNENESLLETTTALESSMLDAVMADAGDLSKRLGAADRARMEQHLEGLRAIERRLQQIGGTTCTVPERPVQADFGDGSNNEQKEAKSQLMSQMLAVALACDLTRVFSYEWSSTQSGAVYWEVGSDKEHHQLSHDSSTGTQMQAVTRFIMKNLAYLGEQLAAQPMGGGSNLLDNTLILGTSEHASAGGHNYNDHPFVLLGKAGGSIKGGVHHRVEGSNKDAPKVLLTAVRAVGVNTPTLGDSNSDSNREVSSTITEIEA